MIINDRIFLRSIRRVELIACRPQVLASSHHFMLAVLMRDEIAFCFWTCSKDVFDTHETSFRAENELTGLKITNLGCAFSVCPHLSVWVHRLTRTRLTGNEKVRGIAFKERVERWLVSRVNSCNPVDLFVIFLTTEQR